MATAHITSTGSLMGVRKSVTHFSYQWNLMERDRHVSGINCYYMLRVWRIWNKRPFS
ncbi:unnamed protein product [Nyctereutes procyonoides]|uniref:(raccoon dog) hypothetical protein n=1 Tax=Nyctereutes procyonoides TaxID=34880 RepID=A0A811YGB4_NYCPR|nr:unnamed protein product [Nyctereutes procyonoides]